MPCNVRSALCVLRMTYLVLGEVGALGQRLRLVEGPVTLVGRVLRQHDVSLRSELVCHVTVLLSTNTKALHCQVRCIIIKELLMLIHCNRTYTVPFKAYIRCH